MHSSDNPNYDPGNPKQEPYHSLGTRYTPRQLVRMLVGFADLHLTTPDLTDDESYAIRQHMNSIRTCIASQRITEIAGANNANA